MSDLIYWGVTNFDVGASESLIQSGKLAWVEDTTLRTQIVGWQDEYFDINLVERQEYDRVQNLLMPLLVARSNFTAIHNASRGRPGDSEYLPPFDYQIETLDSRGNTELLTQPDFLSLLVVLLEDQEDVILFHQRFIDRSRELIGNLQPSLPTDK